MDGKRLDQCQAHDKSSRNTHRDHYFSGLFLFLQQTHVPPEGPPGFWVSACRDQDKYLEVGLSSDTLLKAQGSRYSLNFMIFKCNNSKEPLEEALLRCHSPREHIWCGFEASSLLCLTKEILTLDQR